MFLCSPISCAHFLVCTVTKTSEQKKRERKKQLKSETIEFENDRLNGGFFDSSISLTPLLKKKFN